jgi:hypothetical protein
MADTGLPVTACGKTYAPIGTESIADLTRISRTRPGLRGVAPGDALALSRITPTRHPRTCSTTVRFILVRGSKKALATAAIQKIVIPDLIRDPEDGGKPGSRLALRLAGMTIFIDDKVRCEPCDP